jgi:hypothetical protein
MPPEGAWLKYQLDLRNLKMDTIAKRANRSKSLVSSVIIGKRNSKAVGKALAHALGYESYEALRAAAADAAAQAKGGAA